MEYFSITKTDSKCEFDRVLSLKGGYEFNQRINITLYNNSMIRYILNKKINSSFKNIINMILALESDADDDDVNAIVIKIETLRTLLLEKYSRYIGVKDTETYLKRIEKLEEKTGNRKVKKSIRR